MKYESLPFMSENVKSQRTPILLYKFVLPSITKIHALPYYLLKMVKIGLRKKRPTFYFILELTKGRPMSDVEAMKPHYYAV